MAVVNVKESWSETLKDNDITARRGVRIYTVVLDSPEATPPASVNLAESAADLPDIGDTWPDDPRMILHRYETATRSPVLFEVTCHYKTYYIPQTGEEADPLDEPADIYWGHVGSDIPAQEEYAATGAGDPIQNSAREPFDPPLTKSYYDTTLRIARNESSYTAATARDYINTVCSDDYYGFGENAAKMVKFSGQRIIRGSFDYWRVEYEIHFRVDGWEIRVLDEGFRHLVSGKSVQIMDDPPVTGDNARQPLPITEPMKLNLNGGLVTASGVAYWHEFDVYEKKSWSALNLPDYP